MKIAISYPPIINDIGQKAMVSQNRNVQYFQKPTYLLPVTHAQLATKLKENKFDVYWDDGNAKLYSYDKWFEKLMDYNPNIVVLESTTPVMNFIWSVIDQIKKNKPNTIVILTGYHPMRMPEESLNNSNVDVVVTSNHFDFVINKFVSQYIEFNDTWKDNIYLPGIVFKNNNQIVNCGLFKQIEELDNSSIIDRDLVEWKNYAYENGNFLNTPGTYATSVIRDCIFGKCTFCRYNGPEISFSKISINKSVDEYESLINRYGVKEIFDDSGVWYRGKDAIDFCKEIIKRGLHKKGCYFGINTRFEYMDEETIKWLAKANFRFVLIGLESGDQDTLNRLKKGYTVESIKENLKLMSKYGLHPHITIMVGYFWETKASLDKTLNLVKHLMFKGYARTLQVTLCTPLDYTEYHKECIEKNIMLTDNYSDFDMSKLIVKTPEKHEVYYRAIKDMYLLAIHPKYIYRQLLFLFRFKLRDWQFLFIYGFRAFRRVRQHIFNLTKANNMKNNPNAVEQYNKG